MFRTDKLHQWAPTQMSALDDRRYPRMFVQPAAAVSEPGAVLDDEQIEAAHAATDVGADETPAERDPLPWLTPGRFWTGYLAGFLSCILGLHVWARF